MAEARKKKTKKKPALRKKKEVAAAPPPLPVEERPPIEAAAPAQAAAPKPVVPPKPRIPTPRYYGTGRRKESAAKVWITPGSGKFTVNGRSILQYFCGRKLLEFFINRPFIVTQTAGKYDVYAEAFGGGIPGQATALSLGIARALVQLNPDLKTMLKRVGLLTRDPRMKERKKYGLKRARRAFQYTKR
jgi:small subunit ribosomal protein S9